MLSAICPTPIAQWWADHSTISRMLTAQGKAGKTANKNSPSEQIHKISLIQGGLIKENTIIITEYKLNYINLSNQLNLRD